MEIKIDNMFKFWIYVLFQIVITLGVFILICLVGYYVLFYESIAFKQLSEMCDEEYGEGNWTIKDSKIRSNWYSIGQEFTCVQNNTNKYLNEK